MTAAIKDGIVAINGQKVESFLQPVNVEKDVVTFGGKRVGYRPSSRTYLMLNKPKGIISAAGDERGDKTVRDILPPKYLSTRLYPVGRLDKESTGLILLTDDGDLTYRLTHPKFEYEKEYLVRIEGKIKAEEKAELERGVPLEEGLTSPAMVREIRQRPFNYSITIHEGRKRQVRRMFARLGYVVLDLKRVRLGSLNLGTLGEGEVRELTPAEVKALRKGGPYRARAICK
jgi:23S rRNA pseudouridine2605 synthase